MKDDFSGRKQATILASVVLAALLLPVGVRAASEMTVIKDPDSNTKVQVDRGGKLRVGDGGGALNVTGAVRDAENPARSPFYWSGFASFEGNFFARDSFVVPEGKRLVVEFVTGSAALPREESLSRFDMSMDNSEGNSERTWYLGPAWETPCGTCAGDMTSHTISQKVRMYLEGGKTVRVGAVRNGSSDQGFVFVDVTGYLVDL